MYKRQERTYFRFEGQGGGGGRRQKAAPGCRLFVGGLPREVDTEQLKEMFGKHGDMTDCIVMTDDSGASRGFGFVTFTAKTQAEAAIAALDGHKINGRKIGVRDADNKEKKTSGPPKGLKLYVGNLPFDADEKAVTEFFGDKATINEVAIATDKAGKPKGFAFVFVSEKDNGEEIVKALNGTELKGRRIKVDISQSGGKSVREAVAIRAESLPENFEQSLKKKAVQRSVVLDVETDKCWNIPRLGHKAMRHKS